MLLFLLLLYCCLVYVKPVLGPSPYTFSLVDIIELKVSAITNL